MKLLFVAFALALIANVHCLSKKNYNRIVSAIEQKMDETFNSTTKSFTLVPGFVRLAFHDCVGERCDGCINVEHHENSGLHVYMKPLDELFTNLNLSSVISRADLWALAGILAVRRGAELVGCDINGDNCVPVDDKANVTFRWGRTDCPTAPTTNENHTFPRANGDIDHVKAFGESFGFTERETVALMGAHTLGRAHKEFSGYIGSWVKHEHRLNNRYYRDMNNCLANWTQVELDIPHGEEHPLFQWMKENDVRVSGRKQTDRMQFNTDIVLLKNCSIDHNGYAGIKILNDCPASRTKHIFREFEKNNSLWLSEFSAVFNKMIEFGYEEGSLQEI